VQYYRKLVVFRHRRVAYQSSTAHDARAFLPPVNCPDLHYPRSRIIMAFLVHHAHLQTCTWIAWIISRERPSRGSESTRHSTPGHRCAQGSWNREGPLCVAWVGQRNKWKSASQLVSEAEMHGGGGGLSLLPMQSAAGDADNYSPKWKCRRSYCPRHISYICTVCFSSTIEVMRRLQRKASGPVASIAMSTPSNPRGLLQRNRVLRNCL